MTKFICQIYAWSVWRSFFGRTLDAITRLLPLLKYSGFSGIYLIGLWEDGGADQGFDVVNYRVNPLFGTECDLDRLLMEAHRLGMVVILDVVPDHVSDKNPLALNCINGVEGYETALYMVSEEEARELTMKGVPSFFGKHAFSRMANDRYAFTPFADYLQPANNFENEKVREYYAGVFRALKDRGVDFVRVDCGMMILPQFDNADPSNPMAIFDPARSIKAIHDVAGGMPMFFEWFDRDSADLFEEHEDIFDLDCSHVLTGQQATSWNHPKMIPLVGGHDQMTAADRGLDIDVLLTAMQGSEYAFLDIASLLRWRTDPRVLPGDADFDADLGNPNMRYRARRPILPMWEVYLAERPQLPGAGSLI